MHSQAAIKRTHRASTGTTGDADVGGAASPITALPIRTQSAPRRPSVPAARNGSHVVTRLAGGRWIGVYIYVCCSGEDKAEAGRCGVTTRRGGPMGAAWTQTFFRVRLKPAAKLHYVEVKDVNGLA